MKSRWTYHATAGMMGMSLCCFLNAAQVTGQTILADQQLLVKAKDYYDRNVFRDAEVYIFAYIQRNTEIYQTDISFRNSINCAYNYAHSKRAGMGGSADDPNSTNDEDYGSTQGKPVIPQPPVVGANKTIRSSAYSCNDGGRYYIRVIGDQVWWFGMHDGGGWANVFHGQVKGDKIIGQWADVPRGNASSNGILRLRIVSAQKVVAYEKTGGFGGSEWSIPMGATVGSEIKQHD